MLKKQFTLIELLVVVSIFAILLSILMPNFYQTRELTRLAVCKSNQHQLYNGNLLYAKGNDGKLPVVRFRNVAYMYDTTTAGNMYEDFVKKYGYGNIKHWDCPSSPNRSRLWISGGTELGLWSNYNFFGGITAWSSNKGNKASESPVRVSTSENYWMLTSDRSYKDRWNGSDDWRNHSTVKKGNNQSSMDGATLFYKEETLKFWHTHWVGRRWYHWYQKSEIDATPFI